MSARLILLRSVMLGLVVGWTATACCADSTGVSEPATQAATLPRRVDEVALRYYASLKQKTRVEAEIRRLRRLHPDWQPPADLWTYRGGSGDEAKLWELFATDRLADLHREIAARKSLDKTWSPSTDLASKLRRKELRIAIMAGAHSKAWAELAGAAADWRTDVAVEDCEALWLVAEASARTGNSGEAFAVLDQILRTSPVAGERLATIQKAIAVLPMREVERLLLLGRTGADGMNEFEGIAIDITRARIAATLRDEPVRDVTSAEVAGFRAFALGASDPDQIALLGWYALKRADLNTALENFKAGIEKGGDAKVALGLALTLRRLGRLRDAEEVAYAWREPLPANLSLYIDIVSDELFQRAALDPVRLKRYADVTVSTESGEGAQALGWYAYNACQIEAASEWFRRAIAWQPKETTALGYVLTLQRLRRAKEFTEIVNRYDGLFPSVVGLLFASSQLPSDAACAKRQPGALPERVSAVPAQPAGWSAVPLPRETMNRSKTADFPVPVDGANSYRSGSVQSTTRSASGVWRAADALVQVRDARRVPGVAAMPYEVLGRGVLPGWNGVQQASAPNALLRAPRGSLWANELAGRTAATPGPASVVRVTADGTNAAARFHP